MLRRHSQVNHLVALFLMFIAASAVSGPELRADPLQQILQSKDYQKLGHDDSVASLIGSRWLKNGTAFRKLFVFEEGGPALLLDWLGDSALGLGREDVAAQFRGEFARVLRVYRTNKQDKIYLDVMVPHPKYRDAAEANLIPQFEALRPKPSNIAYSEPLQLSDGTKAMVYERVEGGCSVVIPLEKGGVAQLKVDDCRLKDEIVKAAKALDVRRANEKLLS